MKDSVETQERLNQEAVDATNLGVEAGDFFVCGSERQRDFWLGVLAANGRVNSHTYADDETLRHLVDVVGIGLPSREPAAGRGLKGRHPSIPREARVVLWGGGIWNWLDPLTLIRAWPGVIKRFPDARLVFLGTRHPNPTVPRHEIAGRAEALARETGVLGESVVFIDWVDLDQREALLVEADVGVSLHPLHVETRYSVRSRIMDYFWARLPVVLTAGDVASEWAEQHGVGRVVAPGDQRAVERALVEILGKPRESWARPYRELVESLDWSRVVDPLLQYCLNGAPAAPDQPRRDPMLLPAVVAPPGIGVRALNVWRQEGALAVARRSMSRARRHLQSWA